MNKKSLFQKNSSVKIRLLLKKERQSRIKSVELAIIYGISFTFYLTGKKFERHKISILVKERLLRNHFKQDIQHDKK